MRKNKKRTTILSIVTIATFLVMVIGATYAYFLTSSNIEANMNLGLGTADESIFTAYADDKISLNISFLQMSEANVSTGYIATDNANVMVSLDAGSSGSQTKCTYDIVWVWDSSDKYTTSDVMLPYTHSDNKLYPYEFSVKVDGTEKDLSSLKWNNNEAVITTKYILVNGVGTKTDNVQVDVNVYNIPVNQANLFGKNFNAHIEVKNNKCTAIDINKASLASYCGGENAAECIKEHYSVDGALSYTTNSYDPVGTDVYRYGINTNNEIASKLSLEAEQFMATFDESYETLNYNESITLYYEKGNDSALAQLNEVAPLLNKNFDSMTDAEKLIYANFFKNVLGETLFPKKEDIFVKNNGFKIKYFHNLWGIMPMYYFADDIEINDAFSNYDGSQIPDVVDKHFDYSVFFRPIDLMLGYQYRLGIRTNNYICFVGDDCSNEDNLYRIIGIFDNQLKLVKDNPVGKMALYKDGETDWQNSTLYNYLNGEYLASLGNKNDLIATGNWKIANKEKVFDDSNDRIQHSATEIINLENEAANIVQGKVGLINMTDFLFMATDFPGNISALGNNWLVKFYVSDSGNYYEQRDWTINGYLTGSGNWFDFYWTINNDSPEAAEYIRPSFYLNSDVRILRGEGTQADPMIIGK